MWAIDSSTLCGPGRAPTCVDLNVPGPGRRRDTRNVRRRVSSWGVRRDPEDEVGDVRRRPEPSSVITDVTVRPTGSSKRTLWYLVDDHDPNLLRLYY